MLFLDTSALLKRYVAEEGTPVVLEFMERDTEWAASALAYTETQVSLCQLDLAGSGKDQARDRLADDWERFTTVPVDGRCLAHAAGIGCAHKLRTLDAIHLATADRLPKPLTFLTFDRRQATAARAMGIEVVGVAGEVL